MNKISLLHHCGANKDEKLFRLKAFPFVISLLSAIFFDSQISLENETACDLPKILQLSSEIWFVCLFFI